MQVRLFLIAVLSALMLNSTLAHNPTADKTSLKRWQLRDHTHIRASFLALKNDTVLMEGSSGKVKNVPFTLLSEKDQQYVQSRVAAVSQLNQPVIQPVSGRTEDSGESVH